MSPDWKIFAPRTPWSVEGFCLSDALVECGASEAGEVDGDVGSGLGVEECGYWQVVAFA